MLAVALVAGCGAGAAVSDYGTVVPGARGRTVDAEVAPGQRFSLAVPDNAAAGDAWELAALPDTKVASYISEEHLGDGEGTGAGGVTYFVFNAKRPGTLDIRLRHCWRCPSGAPPTGEATFRITVRKR